MSRDDYPLGMGAAPGQRPPVKGPGGGTPPRRDEDDLWLLTRYGATPRSAGRFLGIPQRRVGYLCEKWARQGKYHYGVTVDLGWATDRPFEGAERARAAVLVPPIQAEQVAEWFDVEVDMLLGVPPKPDLTEVRKVAEKAAKQVRNATAVAVERIKAAQGPAVEAAIDPAGALYERALAELASTPPRRTPSMQAFMDLPAPRMIRGGIRYPSAHYTIAEDGKVTDHTAALAHRAQRGNRG